MQFMQRKPDAAAARRELIGNLKLFFVTCVAVRAAPYVLALLQKE